MLTETRGLIDLVAKGARKSGSRLAGASEVMVHAQYTWEEGRHRKFLKHSVPRTSFPALRTTYDRMMAGLAWCDTVRSFIPFGAPAEAIYELTCGVLNGLGECESVWVVLAWGLARMLAEEGVAPSWTTCMDSGQKLELTPVPFDFAAGGPVSRAPERRVTWVDIEVLRSLDAVQDLDEPPAKLRHAFQAVKLLRQLIEYASDCRLSALGTLIQECGTEPSDPAIDPGK